MSFGISGPDFPGDAAVVFGGSGGLGRQICALLAERRMDVSFTYNRNQDAAGEVAETIETAGRRAHMSAVPLEDYDAVAAHLQAARERFGRIHSIVYASGPAISLGSIHDMNPAEFAKVMAVDA